MSASTSKAEGEALDATVSNTAPNKEVRQSLLEMAAGMESGPAKDKVLEMANSLITPAEYLLALADEADDAAAAIKEKIKGMEATLAAKADEASQYRVQAKETEV